MSTTPIPAHIDTVNIAQINAKLYPLSVNKAGLASWGFTSCGHVHMQPDGSKKSGTFYYRGQLPLIKAAAIHHLQTLF